MPQIKKTFFSDSQEVPKPSEFQKRVDEHKQELINIESLLLSTEKENDKRIANLELQLSQQRKPAFSMQR